MIEAINMHDYFGERADLILYRIGLSRRNKEYIAACLENPKKYIPYEHWGNGPSLQDMLNKCKDK